MKSLSHVGLVVVFMCLSAAGPAQATAEPLTVESYCQLAVERLDLALNTWLKYHRSPTVAERASLYLDHGTSPSAYYAFSAARASRIAAYLNAHPSLQAEIASLSQQLRDAVTVKENP